MASESVEGRLQRYAIRKHEKTRKNDYGRPTEEIDEGRTERGSRRNRKHRRKRPRARSDVVPDGTRKVCFNEEKDSLDGAKKKLQLLFRTVIVTNAMAKRASQPLASDPDITAGEERPGVKAVPLQLSAARAGWERSDVDRGIDVDDLTPARRDDGAAAAPAEDFDSRRRLALEAAARGAGGIEAVLADRHRRGCAFAVCALEEDYLQTASTGTPPGVPVPEPPRMPPLTRPRPFGHNWTRSGICTPPLEQEEASRSVPVARAALGGSSRLPPRPQSQAAGQFSKSMERPRSRQASSRCPSRALCDPLWRSLLVSVPDAPRPEAPRRSLCGSPLLSGCAAAAARSWSGVDPEPS